MLTPYLEDLIQKGKAKFKTYAIGGSGVGTIPVQTNEKVIITDFTWFPFCDVNPVNPTYELNYFPVVSLELQGLIGAVAVGDQIDIMDGLTFKGSILVTTILFLPGRVDGIVYAGSLTGSSNNIIDVDTGATANLLSISPFASSGNLGVGMTLINNTTGGRATILSNTSSSPQGLAPSTLTINNVDGNFVDNDLLATDIFPITLAVQDGPLTLVSQNVPAIIAEAVESCIHHLRFKSKDVEAIFNFKDLPEALLNSLMINQSTSLSVSDSTTGDINNGNVIQGDINIGTGELMGWGLPDPMQIHTYIVCPETVQIDIWKFSPSGNVFTQGNPGPEANEPGVPNGYGNAVANPAVRRITTGQGANIWPLGSSRDLLTGTASRSKNQFYDDIGDLTELALPLNNNAFPLVNISYVLINDFKA